MDEFRLMVFPIVLGKGLQAFGDAGATKSLALVEYKPFLRSRAHFGVVSFHQCTQTPRGIAQ